MPGHSTGLRAGGATGTCQWFPVAPPFRPVRRCGPRVARPVAQAVFAVRDPDHCHGGVIRVGPGRGGRDPPVVVQQVLGLDVHPPGAGPEGLPQAAPVHLPLHPPGDLVLEGGPVLSVEGEEVVPVPGQEQVQHVVELRPQALVVLEDIGRPGDRPGSFHDVLYHVNHESYLLVWYQKVRPGCSPGLLVRGLCGPVPQGRAIPDRVAS